MNENCADQPLCQPILVFPVKSLEKAHCLFTNVVFNYSHFVRPYFLSPESSAPVKQTKNRCFLILNIDESSICLQKHCLPLQNPTQLWKDQHFSRCIHKQMLTYSTVKLGYILVKLPVRAPRGMMRTRTRASVEESESHRERETSVCRLWIEQITLLEELQGYFVFLGSSHSDSN